MKLEQVQNYDQLRDFLDKSSWQEFEKIVGKIFEFHGYDVEVSKVVSFDETKRQYDVIAELDHYIVVDCKKWDNKRRIKYGLKKAAEDQIERVKKLDLELKAFPLIVLSCQSPLEYHSSVPIVSVYKLNKFLSNFPLHVDDILNL